MTKFASRMSSILFVAVFLIFLNQALAGDVFPIGTIEGLWPQEPQLTKEINDHDMNMTQFDEAQDQEDINWFKVNIIDKYKFIKDTKLDMWKEQGKFGSAITTPEFKEAAMRALAFFKRNPDWSKTKSVPAFRRNGKCLQLLYITAARYLFVTYILWDLSGKTLTPCPYDAKNKIITIPASVGACYPEPYGSATCTSDYDVGLVGPDSGILTEKFNNYFEALSGFGKPSEMVFDTNVYAFTLEYAVSKMFIGLPKGFAEAVVNAEQTTKYKMQELVHAYYKLFKYNEVYANVLMASAQKTLGPKIVTHFNFWNQKVLEYHKKVSLTGNDIRKAHNQVYQATVKAMSDSGGYAQPKDKLETLGKALLYAAEAYHTRGAIRHVVADFQIERPDYQSNHLSMMDIWVSMVENWGESLKEYNHACFTPDGTPINLRVCVLKMSKYMWRMVAAMKELRKRIEDFKKKAPKGATINPTTPPALVRLEGSGVGAEKQMRIWYEDYKKAGESQILDTQIDVSAFFRAFGCVAVLVDKPLPRSCLDTMNDRIDIYNKRLAEIFTQTHAAATKRDEVSGENPLKHSLKDLLFRNQN